MWRLQIAFESRGPRFDDGVRAAAPTTLVRIAHGISSHQALERTARREVRHAYQVADAAGAQGLGLAGQQISSASL
jgi:hypothetical protein